jgi:hypothetical protein
MKGYGTPKFSEMTEINRKTCQNQTAGNFWESLKNRDLGQSRGGQTTLVPVIFVWSILACLKSEGGRCPSVTERAVAPFQSL